MSTLLNPADYGIPEESSLGSGPKLILYAIQEFLDSDGEVYLKKVELHISRECEAVEYFMNINMYNMYTLESGGSSLDYHANVGL